MTIGTIPQWGLLISELILVVSCNITKAQTTFDVFSFGSGVDAVGFSSLGTGWTFVPAADLKVLTVSPGPAVIPNYTYEFSFWEGTNQIIASYPVQNRLLRDANNISHQAIPALVLKAGTPYGVSLRDPNGGVQLFASFVRIASDRDRTFITSPFISQFRNFRVNTAGGWIPWPAVDSNSDTLLLGPSFQFQALPPELSISLTATNTALLTWPEPEGVDAYAIQQNIDPATANWVSIASTPIRIEGGKQALLELAGRALFFRLIAQ